MATPLTYKTTEPVNSELPSLPEGIHPTWLTSVLRKQVNTVEITKVVHGTASKVFVTVVYDAEDTSNTNRPKFLCIKGGFDPTRDQSPVPLDCITFEQEPSSWTTSPPSTEGCQFGDPAKAWPVSRVLAGVEQLAALHAGTWNAKGEDYPWLTAQLSRARRRTSLDLAEYRKSFLAGVGWIMCPYVMQPKEQVNAMAARYAAALDDHKTIELVESLRYTD
ncbi:hypothetical protein DHEL01_v208213 [Diaporthe helianthi]|uniref:Aminoglycoside phosphotransferase domain-containing protein n=1 Tax=Diaporthe helianthi TaxID=158607 RepID=A0A2P5HT17_DIAHE|nr:hypothetical protein DHEL01_v208213 [Diaporthe helianthi]